MFLSLVAGFGYAIYNTNKYIGMKMDSARAWAKLGFDFALGFIKGFSAVYTFGFNRTVLAAIVYGCVRVLIALIYDKVKLKSAVKIFINGYTDVTSIAYGNALLAKSLRKFPKIAEVAKQIWEAIF